MRHDNDSFEKKLASYIALASAILAAAPKADAQIIYSDVNPDLVLSLTSNGYFNYPLDLNNDGIVDFRLRIQSSFYTNSYPWCSFSEQFLFSNKIAGYGNNLVLINTSDNFPKPLSAGDTINANNQFHNEGILFHKFSHNSFDSCFGSTVSTNFYSQQGLFQLGTEKYMGLKLSMGGNIYYGWARIKIDSGSLTIYDYSINSTPNQQILAGQQ